MKPEIINNRYRRCLARLVYRLFRCRHHDWTMICNYWSTTLINGFGMILEERCDNCGEYRHRLLPKVIGSTPEWHEGKYPRHIPPMNVNVLAPAGEKTPNP
jgi:hypothetical protein